MKPYELISMRIWIGVAIFGISLVVVRAFWPDTYLPAVKATLHPLERATLGVCLLLLCFFTLGNLKEIRSGVGFRRLRLWEQIAFQTCIIAGIVTSCVAFVSAHWPDGYLPILNRILDGVVILGIAAFVPLVIFVVVWLRPQLKTYH